MERTNSTDSKRKSLLNWTEWTQTKMCLATFFHLIISYNKRRATNRIKWVITSVLNIRAEKIAEDKSCTEKRMYFIDEHEVSKDCSMIMDLIIFVSWLILNEAPLNYKIELDTYNIDTDRMILYSVLDELRVSRRRFICTSILDISLCFKFYTAVSITYYLLCKYNHLGNIQYCVWYCCVERRCISADKNCSYKALCIFNRFCLPKIPWILGCQRSSCNKIMLDMAVEERYVWMRCLFPCLYHLQRHVVNYSMCWTCSSMFSSSWLFKATIWKA